jgi:hypothetical protein
MGLPIPWERPERVGASEDSRDKDHKSHWGMVPARCRSRPERRGVVLRSFLVPALVRRSASGHLSVFH